MAFVSLFLPIIMAIMAVIIVISIVFFVLGSICLTIGILLKLRGGMKAETIIAFSCAAVDYFIAIGICIYWFL